MDVSGRTYSAPTATVFGTRSRHQKTLPRRPCVALHKDIQTLAQNSYAPDLITLEQITLEAKFSGWWRQVERGV